MPITYGQVAGRAHRMVQRLENTQRTCPMCGRLHNTDMFDAGSVLCNTCKSKTDMSERLRFFVNRKYDTLADFARSIGVARSSVRKWVNDGVIPRADFVKSMCIELKISADDLLGIVRGGLQ